MINAIIKGIFFLITSLFSLIFTPFIQLITAAFPQLDGLFVHLSDFFSLAFTYVRSVACLFLFTDDMIITILDYYIVCYSIYLIVLAVKFAINIYQKFKP